MGDLLPFPPRPVDRPDSLSTRGIDVDQVTAAEADALPLCDTTVDLRPTFSGPAVAVYLWCFGPRHVVLLPPEEALRMASQVMVAMRRTSAPSDESDGT